MNLHRMLPSFCLLISLTASATVRYVDLNNPAPAVPFTSWATAATNIQDGIDAATAGDEIVVTNGVYATGGRAVFGTMTNRVTVDKPVRLLSVNGPQFTIIQGYQVPGTTNGDGAIRCVYLTNGASLSGFTLTNGATLSVTDYRAANGGGAWCESTNGTLSNCVLAGNAAYGFGGGVFRGTLSESTLTGNFATYGAGAAESVMNRCVLSGNTTRPRQITFFESGSAGGATASVLNDCLVTSNSAAFSGGVQGSVLSRCLISGNSAITYGGGASSSTLNNCVLTANSAGIDGGGAYTGTLNNCTITGNSAGSNGGGASGAAVIQTFAPCWLNNCVVYFNLAPNGSNYDSYGFCIVSNSCTTPLPSQGEGNIDANPLFADFTNGDLRLQSNSPCINAGNNAFVVGSMDLDGRLRIRGSAVDMGAYEFQGSQPILKVAKSAGSAVLSWPLWASDFLIEQIGATPTTSAGWSNLVANPIVINNENSVSVPLEGSQRLFRLFKP